MVRPLAMALVRARVHANWISYTGVILNIGIAFLVWQGWFFVAGGLYLLVNALDFLDGAVARAAGTAGAFGAFLDSVLDRYSEAVVFVGLAVWYSNSDNPLGLALSIVALIGSFMVSYARARAEGLRVDCEVGLLQRPERIVALGIGMMVEGLRAYVPYGDSFPALLIVLAGLAILTNVTTLQRIRHVANEFERR